MTIEVEGIQVQCMQALRVQEQPVPIDENLIIVDNLESGKLRLYEYLGGPLNIQQLIWGNNFNNAVLVAEVIIDKQWQEKGIFIHNVFWEFGHVNLIQPMLEQVMCFFKFYECYELMGISERVYEKCLPYANEILAGFKKINRNYVYQKK